MRYYYKSKDGSVWYSLKTPFTKEEIEAKGLIVITAAEFDAHVAEELARTNPEPVADEPVSEETPVEEPVDEPVEEPLPEVDTESKTE